MVLGPLLTPAAVFRLHLSIFGKMKQSARLWFSVHSWVGLKLSIFTSVIFLTGTLSLFSWEMDWATNPEMRVSPGAEQDRVSWGELYDAAVAAHPRSRVLSLSRHEEPWFAAQADMLAPWGERFRLWINPYTAEYQGSTPWFNIHRFLLDFHSRLLLPSSIGTLLVMPLSLVILTSLVTGLIAYRKFWRHFFRKPRFTGSRLLMLTDLHRLAGVWSIWFLLIVGITGGYFLVERLGFGAAGPPRGERPVERSTILPDSFTGEDVNQAATRALEKIPELKVRAIKFPKWRGDSISVRGHATANFVTSDANAVFVDPSTRRVLSIFRGEDLSWYQRVAQTSYTLHFGKWGGLLARSIWFVFGLILFSLAVLGAATYGQRAAATLQRKERRNKERK